MCTRYPIINRVSELKVHIELTRFVQPEKIEIDANERAVNEKSPYCFFVCTTFDSFLNDLYQCKKESNIMFRTIRTKKSAISIDTAKALLQSSRRGVLAVNGDDGYPYAIPINYVYDDDAQKIYFHGARVGHKVDALRACDKVCFTVYGNETIKEEDWAPFVQSVVVFGRCHLVESGARATTLLKRFAMKYYPSEQLVDEGIANAGKAVQIFEIEVEHLSGKEIQER